MKMILICLLFLTGCAIKAPQRTKRVVLLKPPHVVKLKKCVDDFMNDHGVGIDSAYVVCEKIYRRGNK